MGGVRRGAAGQNTKQSKREENPIFVDESNAEVIQYMYCYPMMHHQSLHCCTAIGPKGLTTM